MSSVRIFLKNSRI
ncbi:hypothetical protein OSF83_000518 [Enterococcus hirae]|nr:hypothetical protein [Enterococcus hirae]EMF0083997.1 hypothetical protein [Enterococcus hirae]EMF0093659.1 hypothetical protein [Enterococcus hirae]EMF0100013.1 hypothetical protein [Enterococcus hirae]EMF0101164.1 hypothetical protein [Enterococcus hirae]